MARITAQTDVRQTPLYQLVEAKLGRPLDQYLREKRQADVTYMSIVVDIHSETGQQPTTETIRRWCNYLLGETTDKPKSKKKPAVTP